MIKKKIKVPVATAIATLTLISGVAFASTDAGQQFITWSKEKVATVVNQITVDNKALVTQLQTDANTSKTETKAGITEYGKLVGDEKVADLEAYGDAYIEDLEAAVSQLESEIPSTFDALVEKLTKETTSSLDSKGAEIIKKIESSQTGFGGELWSVQNSAKQVIDRKLRVSSAAIQKELKSAIEAAKQEIEALIQNEDEASREEIAANVDSAYENALKKITDSLYAWEVKAKDYLDEQAETYYTTQVDAIDKVVADEMAKVLAN